MSENVRYKKKRERESKENIMRNKIEYGDNNGEVPVNLWQNARKV